MKIGGESPGDGPTARRSCSSATRNNFSGCCVAASRTMILILALLLTTLAIGFILGYATRAAVSAHRRMEARRHRVW